MAEERKDQQDQRGQQSQKNEQSKAKAESVEDVQDALEKEDGDHPGYVEDERPEEDNKVRAVSTPPSERRYGAMQGAPDGGPYNEGQELQNELEYRQADGDIDALASSRHQQEQNYSPIPEYAFIAEDQPLSDVGSNGRAKGAEVGRFVAVTEAVIVGDVVVYKGVQDLPLEIADAVIAAGKGYEPAGKKAGR